MKICAPVTIDDQIDGHFGHCEFYNIFTVTEKGEITDIKKIESLQGCGCKSNIASILAEEGVTLMLAGGIGNGAINVLNASGIDVIRGCSGNTTEVVKLFLAGQLADSGISCQQHEQHHQDGHVCNH